MMYDGKHKESGRGKQRKMADNAKTIAFTGHRPNKLAGYDREGYRTFTTDLASLLFEKYYSKGIRKFISGGAQGFDQLAFWAVEKMRLKYSLEDIENVVYVPFKGQEKIWKADGCFSKDDYRKMICRADSINMLNGALTDRGRIVGALMQRNCAMIDDADILCALNNSPRWAESNGGTAAAMQYALAIGRQIDRVRFTLNDLGNGSSELAITGFEEDVRPLSQPNNGE